MKKLMVLIAAGIGYVLGTKAGRERYDQIRGAARKFKDNPAVQEKAQHVADVAREKAPIVTDKVKGAASSAAEKVKPSGSDPADQLNPDSTALQDDPYPKGDLP
ncbi:hypothetical protein [Nocardioides sp. LHG3406-4]|uniref:hypothetical protein n=1 Tax=Nocardioides sp. LHG3406-4 TaxID=2804575 RepID=UPI003CF71AEC